MKTRSGVLILLTAGLLAAAGCKQEQVREEKAAAPVEMPAVRTAAMLSNTCAGCHGTNGASAGDAMPTIAAMDSRHLYDVLKEFANNSRNSTIMGRIARGYSDLELRAIASFFASKPWVQADAKLNRGLVAKGKRIHQKSKCETCHEDGGRDFDDSTPRLAGQWPDYTYNMLKLYQSDHWPAPYNRELDKMQQRVEKLSDKDLKALAHYYAAQK